MKIYRTLFSGGELFGVGARAAGWQHVDGWEIEPKIAQVACLNGFDVRVADVCDVDYVPLPYADHLHASPSCKNASQANTDAGEAPEDLACADAVCRAIAAHQGDSFSLENVWSYRNFESFARILAALRRAQFVYDYDHINAADFGVPQTRKRLILRAVRGRDRVPSLHPTHRKGGDMFHPPWVGWYDAIADLLPTLPETKPASWQLARMPKELRESVMFGNNMQEWGDSLVYPDEPCVCVVTEKHGRSRAFLVGDQRAGSSDGVQLRGADEPALIVRSLGVSGGAAPRAYIVSAGSDGHRDIVPIREGDEPVMTVTTNGEGRMRAFLLDGDNARADEARPNLRAHDEPAMTMRGTRVSAHRAYVGRWVRMTVQALGRFQTVPDSYIGLTAEINGNGVPCLLAQRIMESLP